MTQTRHPTAHQLKELIVGELTWTPDVDADQIGVAVTDGAVILSGEVSTFFEKSAAVRATLRLQGVTAVADEIVVQHSADIRPDTALARDTSAALHRCPGAEDVKAEVVNRWITLTGETEWHFQRLAAVREVGALTGVRGVTNRISITPRAAFSAEDAQTRITAALERNATVDAEHVHISTDGSTIELTGDVSSQAEYRQAGYAAYSTPGVTHVRNHLRVLG